MKIYKFGTTWLEKCMANASAKRVRVKFLDRLIGQYTAEIFQIDKTPRTFRFTLRHAWNN